MQIKTVKIENFRSIELLKIDLASHSIILGAKNAGKSTILKAIDLFFDAAPRIALEDHYFSETKIPIGITITFTRLTPAEIEEFGSAVIGGDMTVSRELSAVDKESGVYSVTASVNSEFDEFRNESNGTKKRAIFAKLSKNYGPDLDSATTVEDMQLALSNWELKNSKKTTPSKVRGFFGAVNVANGKLKKRTSLRLIPAVKETSAEFQDAKRSPILGLLSDIANQIFENRKELKEFIEESRIVARKLTDPSGIPQLNNISEALTAAVQRFYGDTKIEAEWVADDPLKVVFPTPKVFLQHRGAKVGVDYVGHGLQRAVLFAIVQFLAERQNISANDKQEKYSEPLSDIVIMIEEPEIYQHPIKQKQIYEAFRQIAKKYDETTGIRVQIIYTTHSEKLIDMADFDAVRIIRKAEKDKNYTTTCNSITLDACSVLMAKAAVKEMPMPATTFGAKLHIFSRDVSEGFFADKVVLVEGSTDKAILEGAFKSLGRNAVEEGVSIISMSGKSTLDKPFLIFSELKIPTYLVFDNDEKKTAKKQKNDSNLLLQRLCGVLNPQQWPNGVFDKFAVMPGDLEGYLSLILGDQYEALMDQISLSFELGVEDIKKTPAAVSAFFVLAKEKGFKFDHLSKIIEKIDELGSAN